MKYRAIISGLDESGTCSIEKDIEYPAVISDVCSNQNVEAKYIILNDNKHQIKLLDKNYYYSLTIDNLRSFIGFNGYWSATLDIGGSHPDVQSCVNAIPQCVVLDVFCDGVQSINIVAVNETYSELDISAKETLLNGMFGREIDNEISASSANAVLRFLYKLQEHDDNTLREMDNKYLSDLSYAIVE